MVDMVGLREKVNFSRCLQTSV